MIDTNVLVSGFGWDGPPSRVVDSVLRGEVLLITSPPLLAELERVLLYPKLRAKFTDPKSYVDLARELGLVVQPRCTVTLLEDLYDNHLLEAAQEGHADYIVSGDGGVLSLGSFGRSRIVTSVELLRVLTQPSE